MNDATRTERIRRRTLFGLPLLIVVLIPVTAATLWWGLEASKVLPAADAVLEITNITVQASDAPDSTRTLELPHDWRRDFPHATARYRFEVALEVPPNRLWGLLLPAVEQNVRVYLNDEIIGGSTRMDRFPARSSSRPLYFVLPNGLLRPGRNTFVLDVATYPAGRGYLGSMYIGPDEVLGATFARRHFVQVQLLWLFAAGSIGVALIIGALAWLRPAEPVYRWLTLASACWAGLTVLLLVVDPPLPSHWLSAGSALASTGFCAASFMFALRFVDARQRALEVAILGAAVAGAVAISVTAIASPELVYQVGPASTAAQMLIGPFVMVHLVRYYRDTGSPELFLLLYTGGIIMVFGLLSWAMSAGVSSATGSSYLFYATPLMLGVLVVMLVRRFVAALEHSESLAGALEARVREKSDELARNYARLGELEREAALAQERERIMRDMHDGVGGHIVSSLSRYRALGIDDHDLRETMENALIDLRLMIDSLESVEGDLDVALGMLRARLQPQLSTAALAMRWEVAPLPPVERATPELVLHVLRIVQEAVANVIKHAGATEITLSARTDGRDIVVAVSDDGHGLPEDPLATMGHGLRNMMHRAARIGGRLEIGRNGRGARIALRIPIDG